QDHIHFTFVGDLCRIADWPPFERLAWTQGLAMDAGRLCFHAAFIQRKQVRYRCHFEPRIKWENCFCGPSSSWVPCWWLVSWREALVSTMKRPAPVPYPVKHHRRRSMNPKQWYVVPTAAYTCRARKPC